MDPYQRYCLSQRANKLLRRLPNTQPIYQYDFSHNDYLRFSQHSEFIATHRQATLDYGLGSTGSRLLSPIQEPYLALEHAVARAKNKPSAMILSSGYQANVTLLSALLDPKVLGCVPLVFSDKLNHASMHLACQQHHIKQLRYRHLDYDHLRWRLKQTANERRPRFILTETVFSMDGDHIDFEQLLPIAKEYNAFVYVDEAHATGILGSKGYGLASDFGAEIPVIMGTFSKALGNQGAYVACDRKLKRYFINRAGGFIYSTAPPPNQIVTILQAWEHIPDYQPAVKKMLAQADYLRGQLTLLGFDVGHSNTQIIPIILRCPNVTLMAQAYLAKHGIRVSAIRPPTVGPHQSRLRIALNIEHDNMAIEYLIKILGLFLTDKGHLFR